MDTVWHTLCKSWCGNMVLILACIVQLSNFSNDMILCETGVISGHLTVKSDGSVNW